MNVLAIHDGHDSGACILADGKKIIVSSEERRINSKNFAGVPVKSIDEVIRRSGLSAKDIDMVALCGRIRTRKPVRKLNWFVNVLYFGYSLARSQMVTSLAQKVLSRMPRRQELTDHLKKLGLGDKPVVAYDHHMTHAATAYFHKPFEGDALILTLDGAGDGLCATVSIGKGNEIQVIARTPKFHSPANNLYSMITAHLGMKPWEHEYKLMGMAPYGQAEYVMPLIKDCFTVEGLEFRNHTGKFGGPLQDFYAKRLKGQRFDNVSAACQQLFEELVVQWVKNAIKATGIRKVVASGGAFLNVKANKLIRELPEVEAFYAYPASDDGGTPVGAAILGYLDLCKQKGKSPALQLPRDMYLGLDYTEAEMEQAIRASGLPYIRMNDVPSEIAQRLADGDIIARFDGREEVGPRALGNRTIMADPRDLRNIRKLNFAIKYRDFWMPFAASMLDEDVNRYIKNPNAWPFWMIEAFDTTPQGAKDLVAGIHPFDQTIRPQVVNELNPGYREILRAFKRITGVGGLVNTSFNLHGFPIVGTPEVAIHTLVNSDLDGLALGPFLVTKHKS